MPDASLASEELESVEGDVFFVDADLCLQALVKVCHQVFLVYAWRVLREIVENRAKDVGGILGLDGIQEGVNVHVIVIEFGRAGILVCKVAMPKIDRIFAS